MESGGEDEIMDDKKVDKHDLNQDESGDDSDENNDVEREISFNIVSEDRESGLENEDGVSLENASSVREELRKIEEDER